MKISKTVLRLLGCGALAFSILPISVQASPQLSHDSQNTQYEETIAGKILKVGKDRYVVRTSNGDRISINVTDETRMKCSKSTNHGSDKQSTQTGPSGTSMTTSQAESSSSAGLSTSTTHSTNGTSPTKGFRFGNCEFEKGDRIRAKVDDAGDIIYLTGKSKSSQNFHARKGSSSRIGDVPDRYLVLPAGAIGGMEMEDAETRSTLKSKDGEKIGKIIKTLSTEDGDLAYAIVRKDNGQTVSVPWDAIQGSSGSKTSTLDISKEQLEFLPVLEEGETTVQHVRRNWDLFEYDQDENSYRGFSSNQTPGQRFSGRSGQQGMRSRGEENERVYRSDNRDRSRFGSRNRRDHGHEQRYQRDIYEQDFGQEADQGEIQYSWRDRDSDKRYDRDERSDFRGRGNIFTQNRQRREQDQSRYFNRDENRDSQRGRDSQGGYDYRPDPYRN